MVQTVFFAQGQYNLNRPNGYVRQNWTMSISGSHAGRTESAVMHKLKQLHGSRAGIAIISMRW